VVVQSFARQTVERFKVGLRQSKALECRGPILKERLSELLVRQGAPDD